MIGRIFRAGQYGKNYSEKKGNAKVITQNGLELIKHFESCRLKAYPDSAGIWTIGWGHTKGVKRGDTCTKEQADAWLTEDLSIAEKRLDNLIKIDLTENERDALISMAYNLKSFPVLVNYVNKDRDLFLRKVVLYCCDVSGHSLLGLKRRRYAEKWMFEGMSWEEIEPKLAEVK